MTEAPFASGKHGVLKESTETERTQFATIEVAETEAPFASGKHGALKESTETERTQFATIEVAETVLCHVFSNK